SRWKNPSNTCGPDSASTFSNASRWHAATPMPLNECNRQKTNSSTTCGLPDETRILKNNRRKYGNQSADSHIPSATATTATLALNKQPKEPSKARLLHSLQAHPSIGKDSLPECTADPLRGPQQKSESGINRRRELRPVRVRAAGESARRAPQHQGRSGAEAGARSPR